MDRSRLLIVVGLKREARIAAAPLARIVVGGGRCGSLAPALERALADGDVAAVLSFGVAGALDSRLKVGDVVVPGAVLSVDGAKLAVDRRWSDRLRAASGAADASLVGSDAVVETTSEKRRLHLGVGAAAVDMESHVAARAAAARGLPFAVLRVISDRADQALPRAASVGLRADGGVDPVAVLQRLLLAPRELTALIRTGRDAGRAFRRLRAVRLRVGSSFEVET